LLWEPRSRSRAWDSESPWLDCFCTLSATRNTRRDNVMEQWHYDPAADLDQALIERLRCYLCEPGMLI